MKVIYLSNSQVPSRGAHSMHVMKMAQAFVQQGVDFELVACGVEPRRAGVNVDIKTLYGLRSDIPILLIKPLPFLKGYGIAIQESAYAAFKRPDLVLTRDIAAAAGTIALGIRTLLELHAPDTGQVQPKLFEWLIRRRAFAGLIVITHALKSEILRLHGRRLPAERILVAPDGVDLEQFVNVPSASEARKQLGLPDKFTAGYAGHLYPGRGIEIILEMARRRPDNQFLVVGGNPEDVETYKNAAARSSIANILFTGFVPNGVLPVYLAACDLLLMPYQNKVSVSGGGDTSRWMSPMKAFEYMAAKRPILVSDLPVLGEIFDDTNSIICKHNELSEWENALLMIKNNPEAASSLALRASLSSRSYSWEYRVKRILKHGRCWTG